MSHLLNPADVAVAAFTGRRDDDAMLARLGDWGVNRASVLRQDQAQTARAYIFTEPNEHQFTYFYPGIEPDPDLWLAHLQRSLNPPEIFVQCPHRASLMRTGLRFASQHAALRLWNPGQYYETLSAEDLTDCIAHCDVLIGNKEEVDALLSSEALVSDEANLWRIVTDGSRSVTVQDPKNESAELTVEAIAQGDPTGCGDAFLAGVVGALAQGGRLEMQALQSACVAGIDLARRCVRHLGAQSHFEEPA